MDSYQNICQNCAFFQALMHDGIVYNEGICKRMPPKLFENKTQGQPKVNSSNWCGEFIHIDEWFEVMDFTEIMNQDDDDLDEWFI